MKTTKPTIAVISVGKSKIYRHPAKECLDRLHSANIRRVYLTTRGLGGKPNPRFDVVSGTVMVEVEPGATTFTVTTKKQVDTYPIAKK